MMWVITWNGKPATHEKLCKFIDGDTPHWNTSREQREEFYAAPSRKKCIDIFIYMHGFTWREQVQESKGKLACRKVKALT